MSVYPQICLDLIRNNREMMEHLSILRALSLPDGYVVAGYVRNFIWDTLHHYTTRTPLNDIDVIYYNAEEMDEEQDKRYERKLEQETGVALWSVKNQARMHIRNGDPPYTSVEDAIRHWPETVTAVGVRLEENDRLSILSPYGLEDIFEFRVRRSPLFQDEAYYRSRVRQKNWKALWPKLEINGF